MANGSQTYTPPRSDSDVLDVPRYPAWSDEPDVVKVVVSPAQHVAISASPRQLPDPPGTDDAVAVLHARLDERE